MRSVRHYSCSSGIAVLFCPKCGRLCEAEFDNVGMGNERIGPWHCKCGWTDESEMCDEF